MSMRTPVGRARGLGSAKEGVAHWTAQRISAVALALLTPWFVWLAIGLVGADQALAAARLGEPVNATLMLAYVGALLWHGQLGLQVVIEDYVGNRGLELFAQVAVKLL
ncbi:MAG: succinate dehydrogenase, hydrophobic membrane anchor protein, partial [Gammaproteobacteria bacterium HGW-Gammaproteobacteria-5]